MLPNFLGLSRRREDILSQIFLCSKPISENGHSSDSCFLCSIWAPKSCWTVNRYTSTFFIKGSFERCCERNTSFYSINIHLDHQANERSMYFLVDGPWSNFGQSSSLYWSSRTQESWKISRGLLLFTKSDNILCGASIKQKKLVSKYNGQQHRIKTSIWCWKSRNK